MADENAVNFTVSLGVQFGRPFLTLNGTRHTNVPWERVIEVAEVLHPAWAEDVRAALRGVAQTAEASAERSRQSASDASTRAVQAAQHAARVREVADRLAPRHHPAPRQAA